MEPKSKSVGELLAEARARRAETLEVGRIGPPLGAKPNHIPFVWQDEGCDYSWAEGHVDPTRFVLGVVTYAMIETDPDTAVETLVGGKRSQRWSFEQQLTHAEHLVASVRHVWYRYDKPDDDEHMAQCSAMDEGATPFTRAPIG